MNAALYSISFLFYCVVCNM